MRRFTIAGIFGLALVGVANAQFFDPPALEDRNGSQGFWFYMLEVPNPGAITVDGHSDDWGWFDPEYTLTMDEWRDEGDRRPQTATTCSSPPSWAGRAATTTAGTASWKRLTTCWHTPAPTSLAGTATCYRSASIRRITDASAARPRVTPWSG